MIVVKPLLQQDYIWHKNTFVISNICYKDVIITGGILARNSLNLPNYIQVGLYSSCMETLKHTQVLADQNTMLTDCCNMPLSSTFCSTLICSHTLRALIALEKFNTDRLQQESKLAMWQARRSRWQDVKNSVPILSETFVCCHVCNVHASRLLCACCNFSFS